MDSFFHFWYFHLGQNMIRTYPTLPCGTPLFWISMVPFPSCIPVLWCSWPGCWARRSASCSWGFWTWSWGTAGSRRGKMRFLVGSGPTWAYHFVEALHGIIHGWTKTLKDHEGSSWTFKIMFSWCFFWRFCLICSSHLVLVWSAHIWSNHIEPIRNPILWISVLPFPSCIPVLWLSGRRGLNEKKYLLLQGDPLKDLGNFQRLVGTHVVRVFMLSTFM